MAEENSINAHEIIFGLNRTEDERSLASFLKLFSSRRLTGVLVPRMTDEDIHQTVDFLTAILRKHLSEEEYHTLFLGDESHRH